MRSAFPPFRDSTGRHRGISSAHAFEVGQVVAATGVAPERMKTPSSLRTELTSVLMMNSHGFPEITAAVESLRETVKGPVEVIVLNRGVADGSEQWLSNQPDLTVLDTSRAWTLSSMECRPGECPWSHHLFCDSSIRFTPYWRELHLEHLEQWPDIGLVSSVSSSGEGVQRAVAAENVLELTLRARGLLRVGEDSMPMSRIFHSPFLMVRTSVLERVGDLTSDSEMGGWSFVDWYQRIRLSGFRLRVAQDCLMAWTPQLTAEDYQASWSVLNDKWGADAAYSDSTFEQLSLTENPFHEARRSVAYQSEEDARGLIDREPKL